MDVMIRRRASNDEAEETFALSDGLDERNPRGLTPDQRRSQLPLPQEQPPSLRRKGPSSG
jgi:hypothetical protein